MIQFSDPEIGCQIWMDRIKHLVAKWIYFQTSHWMLTYKWVSVQHQYDIFWLPKQRNNCVKWMLIHFAKEHALPLCFSYFRPSLKKFLFSCFDSDVRICVQFWHFLLGLALLWVHRSDHIESYCTLSFSRLLSNSSPFWKFFWMNSLFILKCVS